MTSSEELKKRAGEAIDKRAEELYEIGDAILHRPELGFKEFKTAALVEEERAWNPRSLRWLLMILSFAISIAIVTYYYHVHEPAETEPDTMEESTA